MCSAAGAKHVQQNLQVTHLDLQYYSNNDAILSHILGHNFLQFSFTGYVFLQQIDGELASALW